MVAAVVLAASIGNVAPTTAAAAGSGSLFGGEFEVVVVDTSTPVPEIRTEQVNAAEYAAMVADGDPDTAVARQTTYVPLAADPVRDLQWQLDEIGVDSVWDDGITGAGITIGIVDTGVVGDDMNLVAATDFTGGAPGKFEHGNTVAAIAAATRDNGLGGTGVAPGASIVSAKVCANGACASDDIARGILWVVGQGADVVNISLGGPASAAVAQVIDYAVSEGVVVVAAAGNSSCSTAYTVGCNPTVDNVAYPAAFGNVVAVTATNSSGASPYWTSKGRRSTVAAPGESLWYSTNGLFGTNGSGTSFSAPVVAGIVALMREAEPTLDAAQLQAALMLSSVPSSVALIQPSVRREWYYGAGDVNAPAAVAMASAIADATLPAPAVTSGDQSLTLSWPSVAGATSYTVTSAPGTTVVTAGTSTTLTGLENGRTHAVSVTAATPGGTVRLEPALGVPAAALATPVIASTQSSTSGQGRIYAWFTAPPSNVTVSATINGTTLGSSPLTESPPSSGNWFASWPTQGLVTNGTLEVWFENTVGATSARTSTTVSVTRTLLQPAAVQSSTVGGVTTISWAPSAVRGGTYDLAPATSYLVTVSGYRTSIAAYDTRDNLSTTSTSMQLTLHPGVLYSVYVTAVHSPTGMYSDTTSTTLVALPPPLEALGNPTVTPSGANLIIGFDTDAAADAILLTSREQVPFVAGTPVSVGGGRSQVTVSLSTLDLTAGEAARVCVAGVEYFDGTNYAQYGTWSTGVSFVTGVGAVSDNYPCTTDNPPGTVPLVTTTTTPPPTTAAPTTTTPATTAPAPATPAPTTTAVPTSRFEPITPERLADTRDALAGSGLGGRVLAGGTLRVPIAGRGAIAADATAVSANITAVDATSSGFLTVWPCDTERPVAASVNYTRGSVDANAVLVGLGGGALCIYSMATVDVVVDITGVFVGSTRAFEPLTPARLIDTRDAGRRLAPGGTMAVDVAGTNGVPTDATAVTLNVTAVDPGSAGYVTVWPCGSERPTTSNLNVTAGDTRPNLVTVKVGTGGRVCAYSLGAVDLVVDVNGWWGSAGRYAYTPVAPFRLADTRETPGLTRLAAGATLRVRATGVGGVPGAARAVAANITVVDPSAAGFVTVWPCNERPLASTGNYRAGAVRPNAAAVAVSPEGDLCLFSLAATDVVIDLTGYWS
jgi:subtilisin family serine protease